MPGIKGQRHRNKSGSDSRSKAWQSMRILCTFDVPQIVSTSGINTRNARAYILRLERAGYIKLVKSRVSGRPGSFNVYRLIRNSGPKAPVTWEDGQVYDPNLHEMFGKPNEEAADARVD